MIRLCDCHGEEQQFRTAHDPFAAEVHVSFCARREAENDKLFEQNRTSAHAATSEAS